MGAFFSCRAVGDAVLDVMRPAHDVQLTILCGHTHSSGECQPLPNVKVLTGGAHYGEPGIQRMLSLAGGA